MINMNLRIRPVSIDPKGMKLIEQDARRQGIIPYFTKFNDRYIAILTHKKINNNDSIVVKEERTPCGDVVLNGGISTVWSNFIFKKLQRNELVTKRFITYREV